MYVSMEDIHAPYGTEESLRVVTKTESDRGLYSACVTLVGSPNGARLNAIFLRRYTRRVTRLNETFPDAKFPCK